MNGQTPASKGAEDLVWRQAVLQTIMENTAVHLAYLDAGFNYIRVNRAYAQGVGYRAEELVGRNHFELFPDSDNRTVFEQVRDTGEPVEFWATPIDFAGQEERGTTYWDWSVVPVHDDQGGILGLVISSTEVTEQVVLGQERERLQEELRSYADRLEQMVDRRTAALRASEARFRAIFEDSVLGIALLDTAGRILTSNSALQEMWGYSEEELEGTIFASYTHPDEIEADQELHQELVSGGLDYYQVDRRYLRSDGQVRRGEFTVSRVAKTGASKHWLAIAMVEDITEKKMNQEALLHAERLAIAGRLGASLAHEINNPLQSVIGCLGLAEEILDEGTEVRRYLEIAMEELERAAGIVTQLRDLSRDTRTKKKEPTDLNVLLEKTLMLTQKQCQNRDVEVEWKPAADLPPVPLVPDRMQQVCLNLVLNAIEAMPHGGHLRVSTSATSQPQGVRIRFVDTGVGITPDALPRIFEPFHSTRREGLGLGLYVSKKVIDEHDGQIEVESQVGEGTTFTVWLPV